MKNTNTITQLNDTDTVRVQIAMTFQVDEILEAFMKEKNDPDYTIEDLVSFAREWFAEEVKVSPFFIEAYKCEGYDGPNTDRLYTAEGL